MAGPLSLAAGALSFSPASPTALLTPAVALAIGPLVCFFAVLRFAVLFVAAALGLDRAFVDFLAREFVAAPFELEAFAFERELPDDALFDFGEPPLRLCGALFLRAEDPVLAWAIRSSPL